MINPFDMYAIEEGIRLKERYGGTVTAISMGPPQAEDALREAIALGCDEAILVSDRAFAGSDTLATGYTLAMAIKKIKDYNAASAAKEFGREFRSPGHVPICIASKHLLNERMGHTELAIALLEMADLIPAASGCEMLSDNGRALSKKEAQEYAEKQNLVFLEGKEIVETWKKWSR